MLLSDNGRFFVHNFPSSHGPDTESLRKEIDQTILNIKGKLAVVLTSKDTLQQSDTLYTGRLGIIYALRETGEPSWRYYFEHMTFHTPTGRATMLQSDMYASIIGNKADSLSQYVCVAQALPQNECELLYGRAGCLQGLLFAKHSLPNLAVDEVIAALAPEIIRAGKTPGSTKLMWEWHGKRYLGAVHGVSGILYTLLSCGHDILARIDPEIHRAVQDTVLSILRYSVHESGNVQSSSGSESDMLVQFCHGATGWVPLLYLMYGMYGDEVYKTHAISMGNVVWQRGLLASKGPGLCHGIGGSVCALLDLYKATMDTIWLFRAQWFAQFLCGSWDVLAVNANYPHSLFEGIAGAMYALSFVREASVSVEKDVAPHFFGTCFPGLNVYERKGRAL